MARDTRAAFLRAVDEFAPQIARSFEEAIQDIRSSADRRALDRVIRRALETGDIERAAIEVAEILLPDGRIQPLGTAFFSPLDRSLLDAFEGGAAYQTGLIPVRPVPGLGRINFRFQGRHQRAEAWTRSRAAALITEITRDQEVMIRQLLAAAVEESRPYRTVVRQLIGEASGNQRVGGFIGLHSRQAAAVQAAQREIAELNPAVLRRARLNGNDRRRLRAAISRGQSLAPQDIQAITRRYADRLLRFRAETIARTEGNKAMNAGRVEAIQQMIDNGRVRSDLVTKVWQATPDGRTRDSHRALHGTEVRFDGVFISPITGFGLRYPHDENAPAAETVNCRCTMRIRINWAAMADQPRLAA